MEFHKRVHGGQLGFPVRVQDKGW